MTGSTTITANISQAQVKAGETLKDHQLEYIQIGSYIEHGSSFTVSATNQMMESFVYQFLIYDTSYMTTSYTSADGEALNWFFTEVKNDGYSPFLFLASFLWNMLNPPPIVRDSWTPPGHA